MSLIQPFRGWRPALGHAAEIAAPPYDVISRAEASALAADRPDSFLHVSRPEIDLPAEADPYAPATYTKAQENFARLITQGRLVRDPAPAYYRYRQQIGDHQQTGLVAAASVAAYESGRIKQHELTRPLKEQDRVRQIEAVNAHTGPVLLVHPASPAIEALLDEVNEPPAYDVSADDGVRHQLWPITDAQQLAQLTLLFDALPALYIADGHHRSAAAVQVAARRRRAGTHAGAAEWFLAVIFPRQQLRILAYHRVIRDLNGMTKAAFLRRVAERWRLDPSPTPVEPEAAGIFGLYLDHQWYRLEVPEEQLEAVADDPIARLDVSLLQDQLIAPLLAIEDPRHDERIDFVGGSRGLTGLCARVDSGEMRLAFALYPTAIEDLIAVADAGAIMPPKSTWFEPKLADGLVCYGLDD